MTREDVVKSIKDKLGNKIKRFYEKSSRRIYIDIDKKDLLEAARFIFKDLGARFNIASASDHPDTVEIIYHFNVDSLGLIINIVIYAAKDECEVESLTPVMKAAGWIEREMHELFGVKFKNHPNLIPLLLPDDWPKDKYPMRKDYLLSSKEEPRNEPQ